MADVELRELERIWRTTGSVDDGAALLRLKLRSGRVTERELELAAFVGDPAAAAVLKQEAAPRNLLTCSPGDLWHYMEKVQPWGTRAAIRLAVACTRSLYRIGPELELRADSLDLLQEGLRAAEAWLLAPSGRHARLAMDTYKRLVAAMYAGEAIGDLRFYAVKTAANTAQAAAYGALDEDAAAARRKARTAARSAGSAAGSAAIVLNMAKRDRRPLLNGVWWELSAWALGHGDVVQPA